MFLCVIHPRLRFLESRLSRLKRARRLSSIRLRRHFRPWRKRELAGDNNSLAGFHAALNHDKIAVLALTWFHRPKFNSVVRLYHKNKRPTLANLDGLRRHKRGVLERVQNET